MRPIAICDTECDHDFWLCMFRLPDGRMYAFDICSEDPKPLDTVGIQWFLDNFTIGTFNGMRYDETMIKLALSGARPRRLKELNDAIIRDKKNWRELRMLFPELNGPRLQMDQIDIMEVAPGVRIPLKTYMARNHSRTIQDLPFDPNTPMPIALRSVTTKYCGNDLQGTHEIFEVCKPRLELRYAATDKYRVDLRSKSDAQMAEAIIRSELQYQGEPMWYQHGHTFRYEPPAALRFTTPALQQVLEVVKQALFVSYDPDKVRLSPEDEVYDADGKKIKTGVKMPKELKSLKITIGESTYKLGIGGLHSQEKKINHHTIVGQWTISDHDVKSYYPSLILLLGMYPTLLGPRFLEVYRAIYDGRLSAKAGAQRLKAEIKKLGANVTPEMEAELVRLTADEGGYKIVLNGTFGKLLSKFSIMFAPELGIRVTLTGQLYLLMLIEMLERCGISVISANTDGIVLRTPYGREWLRDACIAHWEKLTGLEMEANFYKSIFQESVNSYVAITVGGEVKRKGSYAKPGVMQNVHPDRSICTEAAVAYLVSQTPLMQTIKQCTDIREFVCLRGASRGGTYNGEFLGKTLRWYYGESGRGKQIMTVNKEGNPAKVAGSDGAVPIMELPDTLPTDIDYAVYYEHAKKMVENVGIPLTQCN